MARFWQRFRQDRHQKLLDRLILSNEALLASLQAMGDKLDVAVHELRALNWRANAHSEPRSAEGLFRAMQAISQRESVEIIRREMADAVHVQDHRTFLRFALGFAPDGLVLEFGVFSGTTINWMSEDYPSRRFVGFDSFEGLPEVWSGHEFFDFDRRGIAPLVNSNVEMVVGTFETTVPAFVERRETIAAVHVDCDLYSSTKTILSTLSSAISPGCVIIFDEYFNYPAFERHERKAFAEFLQERSLAIRWVAYSGQRAAGVLLAAP